VTTAIEDLAHEAGVKLKLMKKHHGPPSFSNGSWKDVAPKFNLDPSLDVHQLHIFSYPVASLPPLFHREVMKVSAKWLDMYQEQGVHNRQVWLMDAVHASLIY